MSVIYVNTIFKICFCIEYFILHLVVTYFRFLKLWNLKIKFSVSEKESIILPIMSHTKLKKKYFLVHPVLVF